LESAAAVSTKNIDPITFEIIKNRIFLVTDEMSIALKRVSGSTTTTEANDFEAAIYTANGDLAAAGWGVTAHVVPAGAACKHVVSRYKKDQIREGDVFVLNDPYVAAFHQSDIYFISPIHFEGELVGWAGNFTHIIDIGAIDPGGFSPSAKEVFQEGLRIPCIKIVDRGEINSDIFEMITNNSREPGLAALDMKAQLAANNVAKERVVDLLRRYGREVYNSVLSRMIDNSELMIRSKLRELPDGTWSSRIFVDLAREISKVELRLEKKADRILFDFSGTSPQAPVGMNCTIHGTRGSVFTSIAHMLGYDVPWNEGILKPVNVIAPEGSLVNCKIPAPVSMATIGMAGPIVYAAILAISKMMRSSKKYLPDTTAVWGGSSQSVRLAGRMSAGQSFVSADTDHMSSGGGALSDRDGIDTGGRFTILKASIQNIEYYELHYPVVYLFRRQLGDSSGAGKFRGGVGGEAAKVVVGEPGMTARLILSTLGMNVAESLGIFGGAPGCTADSVILRNSGAIQYLNDGKIASSLSELKGGTVDIPSPQSAQTISYGDVFYRRWAGGGGYGDPLERDPELVAKDVKNGMVSRKTALTVYGVDLTEDYRVDPLSTSEKRKQITSERLAGSRKMAIHYQKVTSLVDPVEISDSLVVTKLDGKLNVVCRKCSGIIGTWGKEWKQSLAVVETSLDQVNPIITNVKDLIYREFACPSCGVLADSEVTRKSDPPLFDMITIH
jgi:N-methylhydantoinase B